MPLLVLRGPVRLAIRIVVGASACAAVTEVRLLVHVEAVQARREALDLVPDGASVLVRLLRYDHQERISPREAMAHPYFAPVRTAEDAKLAAGAGATASAGGSAAVPPA